MIKKRSCNHCEGKGYTEIRDCSGMVQRSESCSFCYGSGFIKSEKLEPENHSLKTVEESIIFPQ